MISTTSISYMAWNVLSLDAAFIYFDDFSLRNFDDITTFGLKSDITFDLSAPTHVPVKSRSFRAHAHDTTVGDFCDDNVCACAAVG